MKLRSILVAAIAVLALALAVPAFAQGSGDLPDLPGMNQARRTSVSGARPNLPAARTTGSATNNAPASGISGKNVNNLGDGAAKPAAAKSRGSGRPLPRTGVDTTAFAMLGLALVAGGGLLLEFAPKRARA